MHSSSAAPDAASIREAARSTIVAQDAPTIAAHLERLARDTPAHDLPAITPVIDGVYDALATAALREVADLTPAQLIQAVADSVDFWDSRIAFMAVANGTADRCANRVSDAAKADAAAGMLTDFFANHDPSFYDREDEVYDLHGDSQAAMVALYVSELDKIDRVTSRDAG